MIDLRSDTVTQPTDGMRAVMAAADVGDDVYGDDPTVNELEARVARLLGKEAALFLPTGTMSNQVALRTHTEPGDSVVIHGNAHIIRAESGGAAAISGLTMRPVGSPDGLFTPEDVERAVGAPHPFNPTALNPPPRLLCVENTHNGGGGTVWDLEAIRAVCEAGRAAGLHTHLDGARLWHATAASGVPEVDFAGPFDSVNVCFSKGLGAPVGSALAASEAFVARARRIRQLLGGGMRQAGVIAAGALYALDHHRSSLGDDVVNARSFAEGLAGLDGVRVDVGKVHSNIVRFEVDVCSAGTFATRCHEAGVHMLPSGRKGVRAVFHRDVTAAHAKWALEAIADVLSRPVDEPPSPIPMREG